MHRNYFCAMGFLLLVSTCASAKIVILNGLTHVHTAAGGQVVKGKVELKNIGTESEKVLVYKKGLVQTCDQKTDFVELSAQPRSLGSWLETNVDEKVLQGGEVYELLYTVNVPKDSVLNGSYWALLMVEGADPGGQEAGKQQLGVVSKIRYAIQIIADIGSFENPKLNFENVAFKPGVSAGKMVHAKLKNLGRFMVTPKLVLEIYSKEGEKIKTFETVSQKIYPFTCKDFELEIKGVKPGKYDAVLIADYGQDLFGTNLVIEIE
jgi:hypothetical protein